MTTKLIAALILAVILFGGWQLFFYWEKVKNEEEVAKKQAAASVVTGESLPGLPQQLEQSLHAAQDKGAEALKIWLKTYGQKLQDPRKAWIELDYCELILRADPAEARRIFAEVKDRTPPSSPVWPRMNQLAKTYE
jgi:hypothetical protein